MSDTEVTNPPVTAEEQTAARPPVGPGAKLTNRVTFLAVVAFAIFGIGTPLLGLTVFSNTDLLVASSPYHSAGLSSPEIRNRIANDVVASVVPNTELFADELRSGRLAAWNPYVGGGSPLGAVPNFAVLSPLSLPYYLLPMALAPGYVKLLEIICAVAGCFLFLRRLRLGRAAALLGGLAFASSAFMVMWSNWPQTRVAAFIPAVFWATERLATERRARDAALLAAALAAMLFGGFPAVTGYTVLTAGAYLLVRVLAEHPGRWRPVVGTLAAALAALVVAVLTAAVQLFAFVAAMSRVELSGRAQTGADHLDPASLITAVTPWALGSVNTFALERNAIESMSYVGAVAVVLAFVAVALPWRAWSFLPRGVWSFLVGAVAGWLVLIYLGRWPLAALQQLPALFSDSFVGRGRSVLGFLIAALVGIGFELLLRQVRATDAHPATSPASTAGSAGPDGPTGAAGTGRGALTGIGYTSTGRRRTWVATVLAGGLVGLALMVWTGRRAATADGGAGRFDLHLLIGFALLGAGVLCVAVLLRAGSGGRLTAPGRAGRRWRFGAAAGAVAIPLLVAVQALSLVVPYWPAADRDTFYPRTDVHEFLAANLGHDRFAAAGGGMYPGADSAARLRSLTGETFFDHRFAETVQALPGELFGSTLLRLPTTVEMAQSPVLDRLSVKYLVNPPWATIFGRATVAGTDGGTVTLTPDAPVSVPLAVPGPLRAVGVTLPAAVGSAGRLDVVLRDAAGQELARGSRRFIRATPGEPFYVPVPGDRITPDGPLTAELTLRAGRPVEVAALAGAPAISTIAGEDDGLALAYAGNSVVWQRLAALPRVRWASGALVAADPGQRLTALSQGTVGPDQVVLDEPPTREPDGLPATVEVTGDGTDRIEVVVDAQGAGHLVVADAIQAGWTATVDGVPAPIVPADHGLAAVAVPAGRHTVELRYELPRDNLGGWLSAAGLLTLAGVGVAVLVRNRRERRPRSG
ncbi:hypothetical protein O7627_32115 [Solwaraspora sp. WMMD1047]|uniref:hypothetical protein n=1 Tax=Solwaraspora sp. WMMD1047 TaxID=3016102 RepID=UPI002416879C|nr:hypothetical protein [Solwaraspora sp. WMMD1047]MDG4833918.1 hypothetical protein [Solwaraspora sp. WMMD1047]